MRSSAVTSLCSAELTSSGSRYDKQQAVAKRWRVPEATLCASALAGGWPGGMWAMQRL